MDQELLVDRPQRTASNEGPADHLMALVRAYLPEDRAEAVWQAYLFADQAHAGQFRKSGEPYINHPIAVAEILAELRLDHESLMAALLHDVVEDTDVSKEELEATFGRSIAELVDGVTKLGKVSHISRTKSKQGKPPSSAELAKLQRQEQAENFRKMMLAMTRDIRVILIKLADRLHNMRTLGVMRPDKRRRIARETLDIYAPIAARLGLNTFRLELEDLCLRAIRPWRYCVLKEAVRKARGPRAQIVEQVTATIQTRLDQEGIRGTVKGREKHLYSLYRKMQRKRLKFHQVNDLFAFRVITESVDDCYRALGALHQLYKPKLGRFKDYIALPKPNGYQSLHTELIGPHGIHMEVQIRTRVMDEVAEHGIAAHWDYKENGSNRMSPIVRSRAQAWIQNLLEIQKSAGNSLDFLEHVTVDLYPESIYVFTPKGDIVTLPRGATPVDFAYHVHTDLGHACIGCRIDRQLAALSVPLENGQMVEIIKGKVRKPNPSWLNFVATGKARAQIRNFLKKQTREEAQDLGEHLLTRALLAHNIHYGRLSEEERQRVVDTLHLKDWNTLLEKIGTGARNATLVAKQIHDLLRGGEAEGTDLSSQGNGSAPALSISGTEGLLVSYANCCHPIPGDPIMGFISAGRGLVIHRQDCSNVKNYLDQPDKWLAVDWEADQDQRFWAAIQLEVENRRGVLAEISTTIAREGVDIGHIRSEDRDEHTSVIQMEIRVRDVAHLNQIMRTLQQLTIVRRVTRP